LTRLKEEFDPIRANYWDYRIKKLGVAETEVAVR
jgi:hypothetical protein